MILAISLKNHQTEFEQYNMKLLFKTLENTLNDLSTLNLN